MDNIDIANNLLIETQSLGPIASFVLINQSESVIIEHCEHYQKRSYRNRYKINTSNGYQMLSIPLAKGKNSQLPISDVKIAYNENWIYTHLQAIRSAYGRSPYFEYYYDDITQLMNKRFDYLWDFNLSFLEYFINKLKIKIHLKNTTTYEHKYNNLKDLRFAFNWDQYNISQYTPVWAHECDIPSDVSVLDLLFCTGPEAKLYLNNYNTLVNNKIY